MSSIEELLGERQENVQRISPTKRLERHQKLENVIKSIPQESVLYIIFTGFDPDACGSAMLLSYMLEKYGIESSIYYCGELEYIQNEYIIRQYNWGSRIRPIDECELLNDSIVALVDSHDVNDSRFPESIKNIVPEPIIIIDHHSEENPVEESESTFVYIDNDAKSASTMMIELAQKLDIQYDDELGEKVATIAALGVFEDTNGFRYASRRDFSAFEHITPYCSRTDLDKFINYPKPASYYRRYLAALGRQEIKGSRLVTGIGQALENVTDGALIADDINRHEDLSLVVVWAIQGESVRIFARSKNATFDIEKFLREQFGGGAKIAQDGHGIGGAKIDFKINGWLIPETKDMVYQLVQAYVKKIVFAEDH